MGWIGVDFDGTLVKDGTMEPVPEMVLKVEQMLEEDLDVRIFTARAVDYWGSMVVQQWCVKHLGRRLPVTDRKDYEMLALFDDRAVHVYPDTGMTADEKIHELREENLMLIRRLSFCRSCALSGENWTIEAEDKAAAMSKLEVAKSYGHAFPHWRVNHETP